MAYKKIEYGMTLLFKLTPIKIETFCSFVKSKTQLTGSLSETC